MFTSSIDYTVCSTDPSRYNRINCNLTAPITQYSAMTVTCLTANCCIMILNKDDHLIINGAKVSLNEDYTNLNLDTFAELLNRVLDPKQSSCIDNAERLTITSDQPFIINDMTYNMKLISGFYNTTFPVKAKYNESKGEYMIKGDSVGFTMSTPVLYLISNVGMQSYRNMNENDLSGAKIVMRLNNSFMASSPIIVNNADFETILLSNDLSCLEFTLVDAYMHEIKLLSPMYLSIHIRAIEDQEIETFASMMGQGSQEQK